MNTPAAEKSRPMNAVTGLIHFHSGGIIRSMSKMPRAKMVSMMMGRDNSLSVAVKYCGMPGTYFIPLAISEGTGADSAAVSPAGPRAEALTGPLMRGQSVRTLH